ncbi:sel1 repeat family protein [Photobacterium leiognathi]|uniref:tetratricopeptide repeat protein n=1 Tax=Photobacterium leiognathi TaxID=553611 RepID=UPI001EDF57A5|nr:hypothetical protein [Photobacterium leiognathi]MCG3884449.1 sel1 repeat family protein [Photobacterium leiognathi]
MTVCQGNLDSPELKNILTESTITLRPLKFMDKFMSCIKSSIDSGDQSTILFLKAVKPLACLVNQENHSVCFVPSLTVYHDVDLRHSKELLDTNISTLAHEMVVAQSVKYSSLALLGLCYFHGYLVPKREDKGIAYLKRAAKNGGVFSIISLFELFCNGLISADDSSTCCKEIVSLALNGNRMALSSLSQFVSEGVVGEDIFVGCDLFESYIDLYTKSARAGDARSMYELALCYKYGHGVESSNKEHVSWMLKSASCHYVPAIRRYAKILIDDDFHHEGIRWLNIGAALNDYYCSNMLYRIYSKGIDGYLTPNPQIALEFALNSVILNKSYILDLINASDAYKSLGFYESAVELLELAKNADSSDMNAEYINALIARH